MKKCLTLIALVLSLASFAGSSVPAWDKPLSPVKVKFTDPYVTNYGAYQIGTFNSPNYATNIQVTFNQTVGVPYYAVVQVFGVWDTPGVGSYRDFTILFNSWQHHKSVNFPMSSWQEVYPSTATLIDYGPQ